MKQEIIKIIHPSFEPFICEECKEELNLSPQEIKRLCLLVDEDLKKEKFKGLCPKCTKKWLQKQPPIRGKDATVWLEEF